MTPRHFMLPLLLGLVAPVFPACVDTALAAGGAGSEQSATPGSQVQVSLSLYAGGISFGKMDLDATLRGSEYRSVANFQTSGMVNTFWQSEIQATSSGKIGGKALEPGLYDSFDINRTGKKQQVSLSYDNGAPKLYADPAYSTNGFEVKAEEQKNTLDPLSAVTMIVSGVAADGGNPCSLTAPVFDGRRRYNIEMAKVKDTEIKMDNGLYAGKATLCQIKYRAIAGMRAGVLKRANENFPAVNAWIVSYAAGAGHTFSVPVRVWADTPYGQLSVVADSVKVDGQSTKGS